MQRLNFLFSYISNKNFSEHRFLKSIILDDSVVVDIGSNLGSFVNRVKKINKKVQIFSVEPNKNLIDFQKNKFRKKPNIVYLNIAIGLKNEKSIFYTRLPVSHSSILKDHPDIQLNKLISTTEVETHNLEKVIFDYKIKKIKLLKIDTEGFDYDILLSAKNLISSNRIEYIKIEADSSSFEKIINFAHNNNLTFIGISKYFYFKNKFKMMDIYFKNIKNL